MYQDISITERNYALGYMSPTFETYIPLPVIVPNPNNPEELVSFTLGVPTEVERAYVPRWPHFFMAHYLEFEDGESVRKFENISVCLSHAARYNWELMFIEGNDVSDRVSGVVYAHIC